MAPDSQTIGGIARNHPLSCFDAQQVYATAGHVVQRYADQMSKNLNHDINLF